MSKSKSDLSWKVDLFYYLMIIAALIYVTNIVYIQLFEREELVEYASNMVLIDDHIYFGYSKMEDGFLMHYVRKMNLNFEVVDELLIGGLILMLIVLMLRMNVDLL